MAEMTKDEFFKIAKAGKIPDSVLEEVWKDILKERERLKKEAGETFPRNNETAASNYNECAHGGDKR